MGIMDMFGFKKGGPAAKKPVPLPKHSLGTVIGYFRKVNAAVIKLNGTLERGQEIWIKGHTTDLRMNVDSMQIDRKPIEKAAKGAEVGLRVAKRVRHGDKVFFAAQIEEAIHAAAAAKPKAKAIKKTRPRAKPAPKNKKPAVKKPAGKKKKK